MSTRKARGVRLRVNIAVASSEARKQEADVDLLILYYSGTGNTRFAADVARIVMERAGHSATMKTYKDSEDLDYGEFDACCFATPVYEWAPARNVERFVSSMPRLDGKCAFIVTTSAGEKGEATSLFAGMLERKGLKVLGDCNLICPDSWGGTRRWSYKHDTETPTVESVKELAAFVEKMLLAIEKGLAGEAAEAPDYRVRRTGFFFASRFSRLAPSATFKMGRKKVDESLCNECELCVKNCPVGAIRLDPYPTFGGECIGCWRCINNCPKDCITTFLDGRQHYAGIVNPEELLTKAGLQ